MLVGPTGGGKSCNLHVLEEALGSLKDQNIQGFAYEHVKIFQLNPKSITMGQMYGEFDPNTMEWRYTMIMMLIILIILIIIMIIILIIMQM